jgi:hypothetical protein
MQEFSSLLFSSLHPNFLSIHSLNSFGTPIFLAHPVNASPKSDSAETSNLRLDAPGKVRLVQTPLPSPS